MPRVVEAGLRRFTCAYDQYVDQPYALGEIVAVREGPWPTFAIIADIASGPEDPSRPLQSIAGDRTAAEIFADSPHLRPLLGTRATALCCGYFDGEVARPALPPIPPPLLSRVDVASPEEVLRVAAGGVFLALLLSSPLCDDAVAAAVLRRAAAAFGPSAHAFTVEAGKELARLLKADPARLAAILRGVVA